VELAKLQIEMKSNVIFVHRYMHGCFFLSPVPSFQQNKIYKDAENEAQGNKWEMGKCTAKLKGT
jgi:hypothetical protein